MARRRRPSPLNESTNHKTVESNIYRNRKRITKVRPRTSIGTVVSSRCPPRPDHPLDDPKMLESTPAPALVPLGLTPSDDPVLPVLPTPVHPTDALPNLATLSFRRRRGCELVEISLISLGRTDGDLKLAGLCRLDGAEHGRWRWRGGCLDDGRGVAGVLGTLERARLPSSRASSLRFEEAVDGLDLGKGNEKKMRRISVSRKRGHDVRTHLVLLELAVCLMSSTTGRLCSTCFPLGDGESSTFVLWREQDDGGGGASQHPETAPRESSDRNELD